MALDQSLPITRQLLSDLGVASIHDLDKAQTNMTITLQAIIKAINALEQQGEKNSPKSMNLHGV